MKRPGSVWFLPALVVFGVHCACDTAKKKGTEPRTDTAARTDTEEHGPSRVGAKVEPPKPLPKTSWHEGPFRGQAELLPVAMQDRGEGKVTKETSSGGEGAKPVEPFSLSLDVVLSTEGATGSGSARSETLEIFGTADASALRLTLVGETVRGTFVGHGDEKTGTFQGVVRLSRTETREGKVTREAFSGELTLEGAR